MINKKYISVLFLAIFILLIPSNLVFAEEVESNLEVNMYTDKESYNTDETVSAEIEIANHLPISGESLTITTTIPEDLEVVDEDLAIEDGVITWNLEQIGASETIRLDVNLERKNKPQEFSPPKEEEKSANSDETDADQIVPPENNTSHNNKTPIETDVETTATAGEDSGKMTSSEQAPQTGDQTNIVFYIILFVISILTLAVSIILLNKKKIIKMLALLLALGLLLNPQDIIQAQSSKVSVSTSHEILLDDERYELVTTAEVSYDYSEMDIADELSLNVEAKEDGVHLNWDELSNVEGYEVLRKYEQNDFEVIVSNLTAPTYVDNSEMELGIYTYQVIAEGYGDQSIVSDEVIVYISEFGNGIIPEETDSDQDGITDAREEVLGTDSNNPDTDGDGLPDGFEYQYIGSDPLKQDTNGNGVTDDKEDADKDGINNLEEYQLNTNPSNDDSDYDGLTDDKEVNSYGTNPINEDTDGDGMTDGNEVEYGTDPLVADSDGNGIEDGDEPFEVTFEIDEAEKDENVTPSVTLSLNGSELDSVSISKIGDSNPYLTSDLPGYIGSGYEFRTPEQFDSAEMKFEFNLDLLDNADFEPAIYYFNEESKVLELLPDQHVNEEAGTVTTSVTHFSSYILLNKKEFDEIWETEMKPPHTGEIEDVELVIGFSIDSSGSMSWNDPQETRKQTAKDFVDKLDNNDKAAVVDFDSNASVLTPLTSDKEKVKEAIDKIGNYGGTSLTAGMNAAIEELKEDPIGVKYVILLTDGIGDYDHALTEEAIDLGIVVFTIGLGSDIDESLLTQIAEETGGKYYHASTSDDLGDIFDDTSEETVDLANDTDGDGLSDYHEKRGMRTNNGLWIKTEFDNPDTDGDNVPDGEELIYQDSYFLMKSNPLQKDSDSDGIQDDLDPEGMVYSITDRTLSLASGLSYNNLESHQNSAIGQLIDSGHNFSNISSTDIQELKDWTIVAGNDSGVGYWGDFWDSGLGNVAIKISRSGKKDAIIFATRGTEPESDAVNDFTSDVVLGTQFESHQSVKALSEYTDLAKQYPNAEFFVTGHSLGGRLAQNIFYNVYDAKDGVFGFFKSKVNAPEYGATFNALGFNRVSYWGMKNSIVNQAENKISNYFYNQDLVGEGLGNSILYKRIGREVGGWTPEDKNGNTIKPSLISDIIPYSVSEIHGIHLFYDDINLRYNNIKIY